MDFRHNEADGVTQRRWMCKAN